MRRSDRRDLDAERMCCRWVVWTTEASKPKGVEDPQAVMTQDANSRREYLYPETERQRGTKHLSWNIYFWYDREHRQIKSIHLFKSKQRKAQCLRVNTSVFDAFPLFLYDCLLFTFIKSKFDASRNSTGLGVAAEYKVEYELNSVF